MRVLRLMHVPQLPHVDGISDPHWIDGDVSVDMKASCLSPGIQRARRSPVRDDQQSLLAGRIAAQEVRREDVVIRVAQSLARKSRSAGVPIAGVLDVIDYATQARVTVSGVLEVEDEEIAAAVNDEGQAYVGRLVVARPLVAQMAEDTGQVLSGNAKVVSADAARAVHDDGDVTSDARFRRCPYGTTTTSPAAPKAANGSGCSIEYPRSR